jgi:hypothetical protein
LRPQRYVHKAPENPFKLVKQELFGSQVHLREIEFEWPTEKIFELIREKENLCIESLSFQAGEDKRLFSV